jgi:hypothetical protein
MDNGACHTIPNPTTVESDQAGSHGLHDPVQMEAATDEERESIGNYLIVLNE